MTWDTIAFGIAIYFIIWWVTLFMVLPFGVRTQADENDTILGTVHSAPLRPRLGRIFLINTIVSLGFFGVFCFITLGLGLGLDDVPWFGPPID